MSRRLEKIKEFNANKDNAAQAYVGRANSHSKHEFANNQLAALNELLKARFFGDQEVVFDPYDGKVAYIFRGEKIRSLPSVLNNVRKRSVR